MADAADESTTSVPYRGLRVLSLDGGGVRGLSGLMILKYMMEGINANNPPRPSDVFDLICGTSTGGLIAIMLGRLRMTVKEAIDAYIELSETVFAPKHRFNFAANLWNLAHAKGSCDTAALEKAIKGVTAQKLGVGHTEDPLHERHAQCHVFVCAIRAGKRSLIKFRNYAAEGTDDLEPKIWEAARATSAATTFFDPITIGKYKQEFVDGGAEQNNPVQEAHDEAKAYWKDRDIECVVSIGTGLSPLEAFGRSLKDVGKTLVKIATETDKTHALFAKNHPQYPQYTDEAPVKRLFRFQVARGLENVGMAEHKKISDIADATQNYMEHEAEAGTKQLQYFKALISGHIYEENTNFKLSSVPLEPEKVRYIEKHARVLDFKSPKRLLPNGRPNYSSGTLFLPTRLLCTPTTHQIGEHDRVPPPAPIWATVLARYQSEGPTDTRRQRIPVAEASWCPKSSDFEGAIAIEVPVVDVWRILASFNPYYANYTNEPNTETEVHVHDLWISVPARLDGKPLVRLALRPETAFAPYDRAQIPDAAFADTMCGGAGLAPDTMCGRTVYASRMPGWDVIRVGQAFAFALVPQQNRCYFAEQWRWLARRTACMVTVCHYLWDHANAIDLDNNQVPVKVQWEETVSQLEIKDGAVAHVMGAMSWRLQVLVPVVQSGLQAALRSQGDGPEASVEIEDAVGLLMRSDQYKSADDRVFWDDDGKNRIVDDWWGLFGAEKARWIALDMTIKLILNMSDALVFPESFGELLHSGSGTCLIV